MKNLKSLALILSVLVVFAGCGNMSNTTQKGLIGAGAGAALGAIAGRLIGGNATGTVIGAAIGTAVGTTAGALIGKKMDKAKAAAEAAAANARVEEVTDKNGLPAVKLTFESGILFQTGSSTLSPNAQQSLISFANNVMKQNADMDCAIQGYTDNTGWRGSTAEESRQKNKDLSLQRAQAVSTFLVNRGVSASQIKTVEGLGELNPVADNSTDAGKMQNRRVELYLYASESMINAAKAGTLQ